MPVKFVGPSIGSSVTIDGVTAPTWGQTNSIFDELASPGVSLTVSVKRSAFKTAPEAFAFDFTTTGFDVNTPATLTEHDTTFRNIEIYHRCRSHPYNFTAPQDVIDWDALDGGNRAAADHHIGRFWSYVAQQAGNYIFDFVALESSSGKIAKTTLTFSGSESVKDQVSEYPNAQTVFVSANGDFSNAPSGADTETDINAAIATMLASGTLKKQVMLARGQSYTITSPVTIQASASDTLSHFRLVGQEGSGARPIIVDGTTQHNDGAFIFDNAQLNATLPGMTEVCISGIDFEGDHDPTDGSGRQANGVYFNNGKRSSDYALVNKCNWSGFARTFSAPEQNANNPQPHPERRIIICDTASTNTSHCDWFGGCHSQLEFLGVNFVQNPDALSSTADGSPVQLARTSGNVRSGWRMRAPTPDSLFIKSSVLRGNQGWSMHVGNPSHISLQSAARIFSNTTPTHYATSWSRGCVTDSIFEGGNLAAYNRPSGNEPRHPVNAQFKRNIMIGGHQAGRVADIAHGGTEFCHNLLISAGEKFAASEGGANISPVAGIRVQNGNGSGIDVDGNETVPIHIEDNTIVNLSDRPMASKVFTNEIGLTVVAQRNLFHEPNTASPDTADGPFDVVQGPAPLVKGYREDDGTLKSSLATPLEAGQIFTKVGSGAQLKPNYDAPSP